MDQIRKAIKLIFCQQNPLSLLKSGRMTADSDYLNHIVNPHLLYKVGLYGTDDQNEIIVRLLKTKWMMTDDVLLRELSFIQPSSIFNVLLHYVGNTLGYNNSTRLPYVHYKELLRWQELVVELGEDLPVSVFIASWHYKHGSIQRHFDWKPFLDHDNKELNYLLNQGVSDIHNHLKGTSLNFQLNWLCLMNHITNRLCKFRELSLSLSDGQPYDCTGLYQETVKACAIRLWLFQMVNHNDDILIPTKKLWQILDCDNDLEMTSLALDLQGCLDVARSMHGCVYSNFYGNKTDKPDYAIKGNDESIYSILGGERRLIYDVMMMLLDASEKYSYTSNLLHCYLVIKNKLRHELVQTNNQVGFANFADYQSRKDFFILEKSVYDNLVAQMAVGGYLTESDNRYIETRIAPKNSYKEMSAYIKKTNGNILNDQFVKDAKGLEKGFRYVTHFIKVKEKMSIVDSVLLPRNHYVRKNVEEQARALFNLRNSNDDSKRYVVGIDAANSEIFCRPEVFAQAFRYLRNHEFDDNVYERPTNLGMTYHVGEDFYDIVDGLRAVDEVLLFLNFENGDRLGHAMVLGTDVSQYYERRDYTLSMTKQTLLDNFCWLYIRCRQLFGDIPPCEYLKEQYRKYVLQVYGEQIDIDTYYQSWLLRGDNPQIYQDVDSVSNVNKWSVDPWLKNALNVKYDTVNEARMVEEARLLYHKYHFVPKVKQKGSDGESLQISLDVRKAFIEVVSRLQSVILDKVSALNLRIECNPTSNYKIGEMTRYDQHPILRFYNVGLTDGKDSEIPVTINTDDKGVFATSHEREYSLMALALEKNCNLYANVNRQQIMRWIDNIRRMGFEHRFI